MTFAVQKSASETKIALSLPVKIEAYLSEKKVLREVSRLERVSRTGAEFYVTQPVEMGQLLVLKMPLKKELRLFDFDKEKYRVWAVVRECRPERRDESLVYRVRAAFIGQEAPASFHRNPLTIYKLGKLGENGAWQISEDRTGPDHRRHPRYAIPVDVYITVCDAQENIIAQEKTVTENISQSGASVFSMLPLRVGDTVQFIKQNGGFSVKAIVRNRRTGADNLPRIHLEFINDTFPFVGIE